MCSEKGTLIIKFLRLAIKYVTYIALLRQYKAIYVWRDLVSKQSAPPAKIAPITLESKL